MDELIKTVVFGTLIMTVIAGIVILLSMSPGFSVFVLCVVIFAMWCKINDNKKI